MSDPECDPQYEKEYQMVETLEQQLTAMTERDRVRHEDYQRACGMIAAMHRAAMGVTCGPSRGVVEDVEDLRTAFTAGQQEIARLQLNYTLLLDNTLLSDDEQRLSEVTKEKGG